MSELESKQTLPRSEIAAYLHEFADELDTGGSVDDRPERSETAHETSSGDSPTSSGRSPTGTGNSPTSEERSPDAPIGTRDPDVDESVRANEMETSDPDTADDDAVTDEPLQHRSRTADDRVTVIVGDESATVNPSETPEFEIEVDSDSSLVGSGERQSVTFELEWEVEEVEEHNDIEIK